MNSRWVCSRRGHLWSLLVVWGVGTCMGLAGPAWGMLGPADYFTTESDPFMGNWEGRWSDEEEIDPAIAAQVAVLGRGKYQIRLVSKLFLRCPPLTVVEAERSGDTLSFEAAGLRGEIANGRFVGKRKAGHATFEMKPVTVISPALGAAPPEGAVVLFDGSGFDAWETPEGWELLPDGAMMVTPKAKDLVSKDTFQDVTLHVEFRTPFMPRASGQQRGNSGVFFQGTYEVQILDTFGLEGYYDECGALYKVAAPRVNACAPPLQWQSYEITYRAPRFNEAGEVTEFPRMTVLHNGQLIHQDREMPWITAWKEVERLAPPPKKPGPIRLQAHNNYVQFRNVWLVVNE